ncbi:MAG: SURF1 family protein [Arenimonas sp.]|nr:SURF1 family protein [Arenimonas sp.]
MRQSRARIVKIRLALIALALAVVAGFFSLGRWQLHRAAEKQQMLDAVTAALGRKQAMPLSAAADADSEGYAWASGRGHFLDTPALLLDNQRRDDAVGVRVFGVFKPEQGRALLVDLGWLPVPGNRQLPLASLPTGEQALVGLLAPPPSTGLPLGPAFVITDNEGRAVAQGAAVRAQDQPWLLTRVDLAALAAGLQVPLAPRVLRLDPALPLGYARDLDVLPNTVPPERHRGYALQWFGLALATIVITLLLGFRRPRP